MAESYSAEAKGVAKLEIDGRLYRAEYMAYGGGYFCTNLEADGGDDFEITSIKSRWYDITDGEENAPQVQETKDMHEELEGYLYDEDNGDLWDIN